MPFNKKKRRIGFYTDEEEEMEEEEQEETVNGYVMIDENGNEVPFQPPMYYQDPSIKRVDMVLMSVCVFLVSFLIIITVFIGIYVILAESASSSAMINCAITDMYNCPAGATPDFLR